MKDKDPNEDEFNQDEQDNINEADDSFGLPDLDFNTLDEASEEENEPEESAPVEEPVEETPVEEDAAEEVEADATEESIPEEEGAAETVNEDVEDVEEEEVEVKPAYVVPKPESNAPKLIIALLVTLVVSVGIWYFVFYRPQAVAAEKARIEAENKKAAADKKAAAAKLKETERLAQNATNKEADAAEVDNAKAEATFSTISEPTGRYYIVVQSFIDNDMALDLGKKMAAEGVSTALLVPKGKKKFNRLTMGDYGSYVEAQDAANKLKSEFGDGLWVVKY